MRSKTVDRLLKNTPKDVAIFVDWYADLVVRINQLLQENGINKKELAEKMNKKPSEISKWLNGEHNFTLKSLAKLSAELGEPLLEVPRKKVSAEFADDAFTYRMLTFVDAPKTDPKMEDKTWLVAEETPTYNDTNHA